MKRAFAAQASRRATDNPKRLSAYETVSSYRSLQEKTHDIIAFSLWHRICPSNRRDGYERIEERYGGVLNEKKYV
jgi:hypothetical protein